MRLHRRHGWDLSPAEAIALQKELRREVVSDRPIDMESVRLVAGVDVSVRGEESQAAVVVVTFPDFRPVETALARQPTRFPYIPGLLGFREGPVLEEAFAALESEPDVFLFDGMHERRTAHRFVPCENASFPQNLPRRRRDVAGKGLAWREIAAGNIVTPL